MFHKYCHTSVVGRCSALRVLGWEVEQSTMTVNDVRTMHITKQRVSPAMHTRTYTLVASRHIYTAFGVKRPSNTKEEIKLVENDSFDYRNHKKYAIFKISFIIILH